MLEAVRPSWHRLGISLHLSFGGIVMVVMVSVRGYAATTVVGRHESVEAAADDAFAILARDVGDARDGGAVLTPGRVRGEGHHAATTCNMDVSSALFSISLFCSQIIAKGRAHHTTKPVPCRAGTRPRPVPAQTRQAKLKKKRDNDSQLSRSRSELTHSHARGPPP